MITNARIVNFQSLASAEVEFGKLTVLSGPSNSGKSAFVRALRAAITNPRGDYYRRHGSAETRIEISCMPEFRMAFTRGKAVAYNREDEHGSETFTAVGASVPDPIAASLRIDPSLQITDQFDAPFLLGLSPSAVAKVLGSITKADMLMTASTRAGREATDSKRTVATLTDVVNRDRDYLEQAYGWYIEAATAMRDIHPKQQELSRVVGVLRGLVQMPGRLAPLLAALPPEIAYEVPSDQPLRALEADLASLTRMGVDLGFHLRIIAGFDDVLESLRASLEGKEKEASALAYSITDCPTCGQTLSTDEARAHVLSPH